MFQKAAPGKNLLKESCFMANSGANQIIPTDFKSLFWDTDMDQLDIQQHQSLIVERILNYGDEDAYRWMFRTYSDEIIVSVVKSNRRIGKKAGVIIANFYNYPGRIWHA